MKVQTFSRTCARKTSRTLRAFTLVEVLIAVGVTLITFVSVFGGISLGISLNELARENMRATQIMVDKMEGVRLYNWSQLTTGNFLSTTFTNWFYDTNNIGLVTAQGNGVKYVGTVSVTPFPYATPYSSSMVKFTVSISWTTAFKTNMVRTRSMSTYVSQSGLQNYVYND